MVHKTLIGLAALVVAVSCAPMPISDTAARKRGLHTGKPFDVTDALSRAAKAQRSIQEGYYGAARPGVVATLELLQSLKRTRNREVGAAIPEMYYLLACIDSLASVGKSGLTDSAKSITRVRTAAMRNQALANLEKAVASGFRDFERARKDPALAPVRDLSGFEAALKVPRARLGLFGSAKK